MVFIVIVVPLGKKGTSELSESVCNCNNGTMRWGDAHFQAVQTADIYVYVPNRPLHLGFVLGVQAVALFLLGIKAISLFR